MARALRRDECAEQDWIEKPQSEAAAQIVGVLCGASWASPEQVANDIVELMWSSSPYDMARKPGEEL